MLRILLLVTVGLMMTACESSKTLSDKPQIIRTDAPTYEEIKALTKKDIPAEYMENCTIPPEPKDGGMPDITTKLLETVKDLSVCNKRHEGLKQAIIDSGHFEVVE